METGEKSPREKFYISFSHDYTITSLKSYVYTQTQKKNNMCNQENFQTGYN